jgi:hypothetical protein
MGSMEADTGHHTDIGSSSSLSHRLIVKAGGISEIFYGKSGQEVLRVFVVTTGL